MARYSVLITDYAWPDLDVEREILADADAELKVARATDVATLGDAVADVDAIATCWAELPRTVLEQAARCRIVSRFGIGLDNIDLATCDRLGIPVTNVPDYCQEEVADHTLALLFALARKIAHYHHETRLGRYQRQTGPPLRRLRGQTLGIVGWGQIGQAVGRRAAGFGLQLKAFTRRPDASSSKVTFCDLPTLLASSDFVSLHAPLSDETRHLMNADAFRIMKPGAYLINTARGGLIDHDALAEALANGRLAGAALDVQAEEPPNLDVPPYNDSRVIVTPHAAFLSEESLVELRRRAATQIATLLRGGIPDNVVNPHVLSNP